MSSRTPYLAVIKSFRPIAAISQGQINKLAKAQVIILIDNVESCPVEQSQLSKHQSISQVIPIASDLWNASTQPLTQIEHFIQIARSRYLGISNRNACPFNAYGVPLNIIIVAGMVAKPSTMDLNELRFTSKTGYLVINQPGITIHIFKVFLSHNHRRNILVRPFTRPPEIIMLQMPSKQLTRSSQIKIRLIATNRNTAAVMIRL